jgi:hypothetical protein
MYNIESSGPSSDPLVFNDIRLFVPGPLPLESAMTDAIGKGYDERGLAKTKERHSETHDCVKLHEDRIRSSVVTRENVGLKD